MIRVSPMLAILPLVTALVAGAESRTPSTNAWRILEQGVINKRAAKRANAVHALRLSRTTRGRSNLRSVCSPTRMRTSGRRRPALSGRSELCRPRQS
jgi:hypothetical protein